ncbi:hypothetical protein TGRH88_004580 [Toxoplasma gondii]|uniref:Uncharacterized protein n=1 Tax=Toxoplasma gondii TaxID=5811 RepID=A0A7J6KEK4_TOXGO|nr:hypothetical protein TGRH88_004580 [Toxoplasma gondii]
MRCRHTHQSRHLSLGCATSEFSTPVRGKRSFLVTWLSCAAIVLTRPCTYEGSRIVKRASIANYVHLYWYRMHVKKYAALSGALLQYRKLKQDEGCLCCVFLSPRYSRTTKATAPKITGGAGA